jgi:MFS family permease
MAFLILMRILQGLTGGAVIAMAQATIADIVPARERGRYQGWLSATFASAAMLGPVLGGYLTGLFGWRMVFASMVPLTLLAIWRVAKVLRLLPVTTKRRPNRLVGRHLAQCLAIKPDELADPHRARTSPCRANNALTHGRLLRAPPFVLHKNAVPRTHHPPSILSRRGVWVPCVNVTCIFFMLIGLSNMLPIAMQWGVHKVSMRLR